MTVPVPPHPYQHLELELTSFVCLCVVNFSHSSQCVVVSHCDLICISLLTNEVRHFFKVYLPSLYIFSEVLVEIILPFKKN